MGDAANSAVQRSSSWLDPVYLEVVTSSVPLASNLLVIVFKSLKSVFVPVVQSSSKNLLSQNDKGF